MYKHSGINPTNATARFQKSAMSTPKRSRVSNRRGSLSKLGQLPKQFMAWLLRLIFVSARFSRTNQAGFVLPTTVLLLLILTLTVSALSFRAFSRSSQVIAGREQQTIDNVAAPAVDRAKAKLEYLFLRDTRFPGGVPSSDVLQSMMLNDGDNGIPAITDTETDSPYTFPGETRLDIDADGEDDNVWVFETEVEGEQQLIAYSILMDDANDDSELTDDITQNKAIDKVTRNAPISTTESLEGCGTSRAPEGGWQIIDTATVEKNFQITAFAVNDSNINRTATALEFQQVRQADRGNKWGAWFKYDLELFPGADDNFLWNGAMHTEGNLITRDRYVARMISSHNSCLYNEDASEITMATRDDGDNNFEGQAFSGAMGNNTFGGNDTDFDLFAGNNVAANQDQVLGEDNDSVTVDGGQVSNIALNPIALFTEDVLQHRSQEGWERADGWDGSALEGRIQNENTRPPYLDDTFRADDRYGPKPVYDPRNDIDLDGNVIGSDIVGNAALTDPEGGLDGY